MMYDPIDLIEPRAPAPFREDALTLATTDAAPVLAKWREESVPLDHRLAQLFIGTPYVAMRGGGAGETAGKLADGADVLGMRYLGRFRIAGLIPFFGPVREVWADRDGAVRASFRREAPRGLVEAGMGPYLLTTMFDDGTAITTWSRAITFPPNARVTNRTGTGKFVTDYESHRAAIAEHTTATCRPLRVTDLDTAIAISMAYDRKISPWAIVAIARARLVLLTLAVLVVWVVIRVLSSVGR